MIQNMNKLAEFICNYSCCIKKGDNVFINYLGYPNEFINILVNYIMSIGANPILISLTPDELSKIIVDLDEEKVNILKEKNLAILKKCSTYISLLGDDVLDLPYDCTDKLQLYNDVYRKALRNERLKNCRWIGLRLPSNALASRFNMCYDDFEEYYYKVCGMDYVKLKDDYEWLRDLLSKTNEIRIVRSDTNIFFDKTGIDARILCGEINLPDGEIYTSPIRESVNGHIKFNSRSIQNGNMFENITLMFKNGRVIYSSSNNDELLNVILDTDCGSRYIGEFAIGINPLIQKPSGIILFDEKILGSIHFALGQCYKDAYNGNDSSLHWDLVQLHHNDYGGGEMFFDKKLVMKNGILVKERE